MPGMMRIFSLAQMNPRLLQGYGCRISPVWKLHYLDRLMVLLGLLALMGFAVLLTAG